MKQSIFTPSRIGAMLFAGSMGFGATAHALDINPGSTPKWTISANSAIDAGIVESTVGFSGDLAQVYKQDFAGDEDNSTAAMFYTTTFFVDTEGEPGGATISWDMGATAYIACPSCYLVVKDGDADPSTYIFDISSWNGRDSLNLTGFWPGSGGAISYVEIYNNALFDGGNNPGGSITPVPEAETYAMMLAGLSLVGFAARRKRSKAA